MQVLFHTFDFGLVGLNLLEKVIILVNDDLRWFDIPCKPILSLNVRVLTFLEERFFTVFPLTLSTLFIHHCYLY